MKIKTSYFKKVYLVNNPEKIPDEKMDGLLMCGTKNYECYFDFLDIKVKSKLDVEELRNIELVEFSSEKSMFDFVKNLDKSLFLNYSLEHEKLCVLKFS